jgi:hypothetical protein
MALWKERTKYLGAWTNANSVHAKRFWRVLDGFTEEQKSAVVRFGWGRSRLPDRDSKWSFLIGPPHSNNDDYHLPLAHTCFFQIEVPTYSSEKIMREKLITAITMGTDIVMK